MNDLLELKNVLRRQAYDARNAQADKDEISRRAIQQLVALPEYQRATSVMWYIDCRSELRTKHALPDAIASGKRIVGPYCTTDENGHNKLGLWWLESMEELVVGKWKILEPPRDRWEEPGKIVTADELDFVMVPGVGFDRRGGRMGHGKGYYDKLLQHARADAPLVALAFECQLFPEIPMQSHDIYMDKVITEAAVYQGLGRKVGCV
jgi:5-formyltetrahydrofolate cyclo-ligase